MLPVEALPTVNAVLNTCSALCLVSGRIAIARRRVELHRFFMLAAFAFSVLFLSSYLVYHFSTHIVTPFAGTGIWRPVYYTLLVLHSVLAATVPVLAVMTLWRAWRKDFRRHRALARWTFPIWLFVSISGVLVYLMLYHFFPGRS